MLLFAILFGVALASFSESAPPVLMEVLDQALHVIFRIVGCIMHQVVLRERVEFIMHIIPHVRRHDFILRRHHRSRSS